jgi:chromosome segregation ATPase
MTRKIGFGLIAAVLTVAALWVVSAITLGPGKTNSLIGWAFCSARPNANNQVPVEVEIERLRHEIAQLIPDMKKNISQIAEETVTVRNLKKEVETQETVLAKQKTNMLAASRQLEAGEYPVVYNDREYTPNQAREKLAKELDQYKRSASDLKFKKELLEAKETSLEKAKEQLTGLKDQKRELEVQLAKLEAKAKALEVAQTRSKFQFNDARMTGIKKSLEELETRVRVEEEKLKLYEDFTLEGRPIQTPKPGKSTKDVAQEVRDYFGETDNAVAGRK